MAYFSFRKREGFFDKEQRRKSCQGDDGGDQKYGTEGHIKIHKKNIYDDRADDGAGAVHGSLDAKTISSFFGRAPVGFGDNCISRRIPQTFAYSFNRP